MPRDLTWLVRRERESRPKLTLSSLELKALVEAVKAAEEFKPSQDAKRRVFAKYGLLGSERERVLTAVFYDTMKRLGLLDRVVEWVAGAHPLILDPWLRAALRVAAELIHFNRLDEATRERLRGSVAALLSRETHPYVGMWYWENLPKVARYRWIARSWEEEMEIRYCLPAWLARRAKQLLGPREAKRLMEAWNRVPPISVRVNTLKATVEEVVEELRREGVEPRVSERVPVVVKFRGPYDFDRSRLYREGKIIPQEEAAAAASLILKPEPGETVVDLCAAPGGKTTHMAELMRNKGVIHAFDIDEERMARMRMLAERMGITIIKQHLVDARRAPEVLGEEVADRVMVDPPCTSTGTLMKNPELRWRTRPEKIPEIVKLQEQILEAGVRLLKPGGRLLYTTCSVLPEEGELLVKRILGRHPELKIVPLRGPYEESKLLPGTMRAWPHKHGTIGFYYALLEKRG